jgi:hypothetical protein
VISQNLDYSPRLLAANNVAVPVNGFPVTGFASRRQVPASPDDANYGRSIDSITAQLRLPRPHQHNHGGVIDSADLDALTAGLPRTSRWCPSSAR